MKRAKREEDPHKHWSSLYSNSYTYVLHRWILTFGIGSSSREQVSESTIYSKVTLSFTYSRIHRIVVCCFNRGNRTADTKGMKLVLLLMCFNSYIKWRKEDPTANNTYHVCIQILITYVFDRSLIGGYRERRERMKCWKKTICHIEVKIL